MKQKEFSEKLEKLKKGNWKVRGILEANGNDFNNIPEFQQKIFLKYLGIDEVILEKKITV